jgi:soluble lytic murein transglycosylase-like protein
MKIVVTIAALAALLLFCGLPGQRHTAFAVTLPPAAPTPPPPPPQPRLSPEEAWAMVSAAALKHNVPAALVKSIMAAESNFDPNAVSRTGAIGLMQLMPDTAKEYGIDPKVPAQNVDGGTHYLRVLMNRYSRSADKLRRVIAAYNAGPHAVDRYRGVPPYRETRTYVVRVLKYLRQFRDEEWAAAALEAPGLK